MKRILQIIIGNNNTQVCGVPNDFRSVFKKKKDIYFVYGDSDVQLLSQNNECESTRYHDFMEITLKLLLIFKPISSRIVIPASSLCSSLLTRLLVNKYECFSIEPNPHICIIRKETSWKEYFEKRKHNSKSLEKIEKYSLFSNKNAAEYFAGLSVTRKIQNSGFHTSVKWVDKAASLLPEIVNGYDKKNINLHEISEEVLYDSIFVWEVLEKKLNERGIKIPEWNSQLRYALAEAYFSSFKGEFMFPFNDPIGLAIEQRERYYYLNVGLLNIMMKKAGLYESILSISPAGLFKTLYSDELLRYKDEIRQSTNENKLLINSKKYSKLMHKALSS